MRRFLQGLALIVVGVTAGVLIIEGAFHLADVAPVHELRRFPEWMNQSHEVLGWFHVPGSRFKYNTRFVSFNTDVTINSKGLRDRDYPYEKEQGTYRILVLGDSFTAGLELPLEQVWHEVLEERLNERPSRFRKVEVIAAGVQGWGTDQQLLYYRHEGHKYNPDLVLLQMFHDLSDNDVNLRTTWNATLRDEKPYFVLADGKLELRNFPYKGEGLWWDAKPARGLSGQVRRWLRRSLRVYRFTRATVINLRTGSPGYLCNGGSTDLPNELLIWSPSYPPDYQAAWQLTERLIQELQVEVTRRNQRLVVVSFPDRRQVHAESWEETLECWPSARLRTWDLDAPSKTLDAILRKVGTPGLDLTQRLRAHAASTGSTLYLGKDWHFNSEGHQVVAKALYEWLVEQGRFSQ